MSPDSLVWSTPDGPVQSARLNDFIRTLPLESYTQSDRRKAFDSAKQNAILLHNWLADNLDIPMAQSLGLDFRIVGRNGRPRFEVHSVRPARRVTPDGEARTDVVALITQWRKIPFDPARPDGPGLQVRGGCTLVMDREYGTDPIRYAIVRPVWSETGERRARQLAAQAAHGPNALYGPAANTAAAEPFAAMHRGLQPDTDLPSGVG